MNKRIRKSLRLQLLFAAIISVCISAITFGLSFILGNTLLDRTVYTDSFSHMMAEKQFSKLKEYVEAESIDSDNINQLNEWCIRKKKIYIVMYSENDTMYEFPASGNIKGAENSIRPLPDEEALDNAMDLTLNDGKTFKCFIYYYVGSSFYLGMIIVSGLLAFAAFSTSFIIFVNKKVSYITLLRHELEILSGGQLEYPVTVKGNDEIGELALGIDEMRRSILNHLEIENQMRDANSELITSMSHDLRTPLTSLLAYLELIERKKYTDEEQMNNLIQKSVSQTMRIRDMADRLFRYFFIYATEWENAELEKADADQLFGQIIDDYSYSLKSKGMNVNVTFTQTGAQIDVNTELLQRVLDNLYSNLLKYADSETPIEFYYGCESNELIFTIKNAVSVDREKKDSTSIGLNTCKRIIEYHRGKFVSSEESGTFTVNLIIPISNTPSKF